MLSSYIRMGVIVFSFLVSTIHINAEDGLSKDTLVGIATQSWRQLESQGWSDACTTWKEARTESLTGKPAQTSVCRYVLNTLQKSFSLQKTVVGIESTGSNFVVRNDQYAFEVDQTATHEPYTLNYWGDEDNNAIQGEVDTTIATLKTPWSIYTAIPMWEIINDSSFSVNELKYQDGETSKNVMLRFSLDSRQEGHIGEIKEGEIVFDSARYWAIQGYQLKLKHKDDSSTFEVKAHVQYDNSEIPVMTRQEYSLIIKPGQITWVSEIESRVPCEMTDRDFRLTAFGLPEIGKSHLKERILLSLVGVIALCIVFWRLQKKKKS